MSERQLREGGPTPYVRCVSGPAPRARQGRVGGLAFELRERSLTLSHSAPVLRLAVFSGAGFGGSPPASALERLRQTRVDALLMLGGLGDGAQQAEATARALAGLGRLVLIVSGGRDGYRSTRSALDALGPDAPVVDVSPLRGINFGKNVLVPWAGAEHGRYALDESRCGFGAKDIEEAVAALGTPAPDERRWLVSWQALPRAAGRAAVREGQELGASLIGLAERLGVQGSLGAWPIDASPALTGPLEDAIVPRAWGPALELPDTTIAPNAVMIATFDAAGARIER